MEERTSLSSPAAYRRRQQIEDCLLRNLRTTSYQSISVADLCRQVGISRKAFYNYYHDKEDCLLSLLDRAIQEAVLHVSSIVPEGATTLESCTILLEYWKEQKDFWDIVFRNQLLHFVLMQVTHYMQTEEKSIMTLLSTPDVETDTDILSCYLACQATLYFQWYFRDFDTPAEEMAKKYLRLMHVPLIASANNKEQK